MPHLIFNQDDEFLDVLNFESEQELIRYKTENPTHILKEEEDFTFIEEDDLYDDDVDEVEW